MSIWFLSHNCHAFNNHVTTANCILRPKTNSGIIDYKEFRNAIFPEDNLTRNMKDWDVIRRPERRKLVDLYARNANIIRTPSTLYVAKKSIVYRRVEHTFGWPMTCRVDITCSGTCFWEQKISGIVFGPFHTVEAEVVLMLRSWKSCPAALYDHWHCSSALWPASSWSRVAPQTRSSV